MQGAAQPLCASIRSTWNRAAILVVNKKRREYVDVECPSRTKLAEVEPKTAFGLTDRSKLFFFPQKNQRLRRQTHVSLSRHRSAYCHFVSVSAMEGNQQGGHATMHVKSEAVDESTPASSGLCSQEPPACKGEPGGGGGGGEHQTAEELQAAATATPVLLCE